MRLRYAIVFVTDLKRSLEFYRDLVGLPLREERRSSVEFDVGGATFALHLAHVDAPRHHHPPMLAGSCRLGFEVEDLMAVHQRLIGAGVPCLSPPEAQMDLQVALYEDPDGLNFTLAEEIRR
jgi:lactoylglutathione lyase